MKQHLLKEIELGTKSALLKRKLLHIIYIMAVQQLPTCLKNWILVSLQSLSLSVKCAKKVISTTMVNWKQVEDGTLTYMA